eukprot:GHVU01230473.1.p1 GENE.GHVU01230473.1~~GHVU01230473.1.p1  ORF type:complete len:327 (+),score=43.35 GHVU01230473.1:1275-2255(+)
MVVPGGKAKAKRKPKTVTGKPDAVKFKGTAQYNIIMACASAWAELPSPLVLSAAVVAETSRKSLARYLHYLGLNAVEYMRAGGLAGASFVKKDYRSLLYHKYRHPPPPLSPTGYPVAVLEFAGAASGLLPTIAATTTQSTSSPSSPHARVPLSAREHEGGEETTADHGEAPSSSAPLSVAVGGFPVEVDVKLVCELAAFLDECATRLREVAECLTTGSGSDFDGRHPVPDPTARPATRLRRSLGVVRADAGAVPPGRPHPRLRGCGGRRGTYDPPRGHTQTRREIRGAGRDRDRDSDREEEAGQEEGRQGGRKKGGRTSATHSLID